MGKSRASALGRLDLLSRNADTFQVETLQGNFDQDYYLNSGY
jgi:hypothetical protein